MKTEIAYIVLFLLSILVFYLLKKVFDSRTKIEEFSKLLEEGQGKVEQAKSLIASEEELKRAKKKLEEKNKKLWAMSEAVHKEKQKVDEQNEKLVIEKEKLEVDKKKLDEKVKKLWQTSTAVHKEKERINELKNSVEEKHQSIVDSVTYAKRIQDAILPTLEEMESNLPDSFVLFKPRDIVSGDFYWFASQPGYCILACCDCTGHGVPGAFMSMIGNTLINQIVLQKGIKNPEIILTELDKEINISLKQIEQPIAENGMNVAPSDGMDVALVCLESTSDGRKILHFAGANRPLYLVRNKELLEYKSAKVGIGGFSYTEEPKKFIMHDIPLEKGDSIYLSTDGYADQFNKEEKKLMTKKFKEVLIKIHALPASEQKEYLDRFISEWKEEEKQTDDICVIGFSV